MTIILEKGLPDPHALMAFKHAIDVKVFSKFEKDSYYWIANWMYMGTKNDFDLFKNRDDKEYIKVHHSDKRETKLVRDRRHSIYG
tara:strand:+ start:610 stop:864 length:255 start_codon:yes stop_codon:yes gene_type:complete